MFQMRPGAKFKMWTGGFTNRPSVDAPWLLKLVSVLAIFSIVGALVYMVALTIGASDIAVISNEEAIYVAILHFVMPIALVYAVTTNSPTSRFLILVYSIALYISTNLGKGYLGSLDVKPELRLVALTAMLVTIILWLFLSPRMRFYYALISGRPVPRDLESRAASFMDDSKLNPKVRAAIDWVADHLETIVLLGFSVVAIYAYISTASADVNKREAYEAQRKRVTTIYRSRPVRIDEPLREDNVSDEEIRQIQTATSAVYPGAIANVSGVIAGCPCEDGATCDSQVWVLAHRNSRYDGLMLSRIENTWTVGPLQSWWLENDKLTVKMREVWRNKKSYADGSYLKLMEERQALYEIFPFCDDET